LTSTEYGKSRIRLTKVEAHPGGSRVRELAVSLLLRGEFGEAYRHGENSKIIATDSMKNTVQVFAHRDALDGIETFARRLGRHFLETYAHVDRVEVEIEEVAWVPLPTPGEPEPDVFSRAGSSIWTASVVVERGSTARVSEGVRDLELFRSSGSSFSGFIRDEWTTLPETQSRAVATNLAARWHYGAAGATPEQPRQKILNSLVQTFAVHGSKSLQHTLHAMGQAALSGCDAIERIWLCLENKHLLPFDASVFGIAGQGELYTPIDEPSGRITGELERVR
jgi:urate oxidase